MFYTGVSGSYIVTSTGGKQDDIGWIRLRNPIADMTDAEIAELAAALNNWSLESMQQRIFYDESPNNETPKLPKPHGILLRDPVQGKTVSEVIASKLVTLEMIR